MKTLWRPSIHALIFLAFVLMILVGAAILIAYGIKYNEMQNSLEIFGLLSYGNLSITLGALVLGTTLIAIIIAVAPNPLVFTIYAGILMLICPFQLALGVMSVVKTENSDYLQEVVQISLDIFSDQELHNVEEKFECCGINGYWSFKDYHCFDPALPGCASAFTEAMEWNIQTIGCCSIILATVEVAAAFFILSLRENGRLLYCGLQSEHV